MSDIVNAAKGVAWRQVHNFFTNPPLCITEAELREGFDIIDTALTRLEESM